MTKLKREGYNAYMADYLKKRYHARRAVFLEQMGGKCVRCGSKDDLHFHHRNPAEKSFEVSRRLTAAPIAVLEEEELKKCELLCAACHKVAHSWQHGTLVGYRYCKCTECKAAKAAWSRTYNRPERRPV